MPSGAKSGVIVAGIKADGQPINLLLNNDGSLPVTGAGGGGGGDGAILDGVSATIKATVFDLTNSNPLATRLVDANGDPVSVGGGTQYSEDSPAVDAEQLTMAGVVRKDARGTLVSADGDRTELQVNASGDLRVDGSAVTQPISAVSLPTHDVVDQGEYNTTKPTYVSGNAGRIQMGSRGSLRVQLAVADSSVDIQSRNTDTVSTDWGVVTRPLASATAPLHTQVVSGGAVIDPRAIRALTSADVVDISDRAARLLGKVRQTDGTLDLTLLNSAPGSDTGQVAVPVRVISSLAGGSGGTTQYAEDTASVDAEQIVMVGVVRKDTRAAISGTDGDRTELQVNASGDLRVDGSAVTQPISAVSLPLPTGASQEHTTAASPHSIRLSDGAAFYDATKTGQLPAALVSGRLDVNLGATIAVPVTDNAGSLTVDNAGTFSVQDTQVIADNAGFTDGTSKVFPLGFIFDEVAGTALTENDIGAARIDSKRATIGVIEDATTRGQRATVTASNALKVDGSAVTQPISAAAALKVNAEPETSGGLTIGRLISAASTNGTSTKASAGQVYGWYLYNANAAVRYLKLYNKASAPTVGTDTPVMTIPIPPGAAANVEFTNGIAFGTGIAFALTTGVADSDTGAVAANEIVVNLLYK